MYKYIKVSEGVRGRVSGVTSGVKHHSNVPFMLRKEFHGTAIASQTRRNTSFDKNGTKSLKGLR